MKKQTVEKILMVICIVGIIALAKGFVNKQMRLDEMKKAHVDSLEKVALKVDSLENIVSMYDIQNPYWEVEIDTSGKDFTDYFERNFGRQADPCLRRCGRAFHFRRYVCQAEALQRGGLTGGILHGTDLQSLSSPVGAYSRRRAPSLRRPRLYLRFT